MSKRSIQFAGVLFMLAAILAVSAQENTTTLNNATVNNTTLLNNTTFNATTSEPVSVPANETVIEAPILPTETANETAPTVSAENESAPTASEIIPAQNETAPAQNITLSENVTAFAEPVSSIPAVLQPGAMQIESPQRTVFAIGGSGRSPSLFPIDGNALAQGAYEVGLPAKTIMDLSALPFFVNKI
ncbi:MAG: hypothetical protein M0Q13_04115 [Methanothrix sp.]|nr:hypothetical protein [Methanothrix sp.]